MTNTEYKIPMLAQFQKQPRAFYMIFMLEIWERFGFYTVQGILTLYFIRFLGFNDTQAYYTFGAFSALVYGYVALGGFIGDKILGTKRTIILGLITLASGYLSLSLASTQNVFWALGLVCVGNGLFKANPSSLLSKSYKKNDPRLHGGFTLYYMAINLGSIVALFTGPYLSSKYGYSYAYFVSFIGILLGITNYGFQYRQIQHINNAADKKKKPIWRWISVVFGILFTTYLSAYLLQHVAITERLIWLIIILAIAVYAYFMTREKKKSVIRMAVALVLMAEAIVFFTLYQQMPTSLNLFAINNVHPYLLGLPIDPQSFQTLNPIWIILISPVLAAIYSKIHTKHYTLAMPYKFALGMTCCGISFGLLYFARFFGDANGQISSWWLVVSYFFQSTGELLVAALGVAMVAELVPHAIVGFVMGMWFLTSSIAGFTGAYVASTTALPEQLGSGYASLLIYTQAFGLIGVITLAIALLLWISAPFLSRLIR